MAHRNSLIAVGIRTSNFLCGVIHVVIKALLEVRRNGVTPSRVPSVVRGGGEGCSNPATRTYKLCLGHIGCRGSGDSRGEDRH